jgi:hypothetical protein
MEIYMSNGNPAENYYISRNNLPTGAEGVVGFFLAAFNLPAVLNVRLLGTATSPINHAKIYSNGLKPRSMLMEATLGLTPNKKIFTEDSLRRIYLGGYHSANVYSNMLRLSASDPDWRLTAKNNRFSFYFLFKPNFGIFKYPIWSIVPEQIFRQNFTIDENSVVKIFSKKFFGITNIAPIPAAYKSTFDFFLPAMYFIGSPHFNPSIILSSSLSSIHINPLRFIRGSAFFSAGSFMMYDAYNRFRSIE